MKPCTRCGTMLADDATYCTNCNTEQPKRFEEFELPAPQNTTFLKVLCILTIVGVVFTMISTAVSLSMGAALPIKGFESLTYVNFGVATCKLIAAILMLRKKLSGLYLYTAAAVGNIAVQIYSATLTADYMNSILGGNGSTIAIAGTAVTVVIALAFLILYWLPVNRKLLS